MCKKRIVISQIIVLHELNRIIIQNSFYSGRESTSRFSLNFMFKLSSSKWKEVVTNCDNLPEGDTNLARRLS